MISFTCLDLLVCAELDASRAILFHFRFCSYAHKSICHKRQTVLLHTNTNVRRTKQKNILSCQMPYKSCVCCYCKIEAHSLCCIETCERISCIFFCSFVVSFYSDQKIYLANNIDNYLFCLLNVKYMIFNLIGMELHRNTWKFCKTI